MDSTQRTGCLINTRVEILQHITDWLEMPSNLAAFRSRNVLWLHGVAGMGKSTISTSIYQHFRDINPHHVVFLHFHRNELNSDPGAVIRTLCYHLARSHDVIRTATIHALQARPGIEDDPIQAQFEALLEPLNKVVALQSGKPIVVIMDALDECGNRDTRTQLLKVLREGLAKLPLVFRIFITSRDEFDMHPFHSLPNVISLKLSDAGSNDSDIESYLKHSLDEISRSHNLHDWPSKNDISKLVELADGLFIWAATAVKFVSGGVPPPLRLNRLLHPFNSQSHSGLDGLYRLTLEGALEWTDPTETDFYRSCLGAIATARVPITDTIIDEIVNHQDNSDGSVRLKPKAASFLPHIGSLVAWGGPGKQIRALHATFFDYLVNPGLCGQLPWFIDLPTHHHTFAVGCFALMTQQLHFNIGNYKTPNERDFAKESELRSLKTLSSSLVYASRHWAYHLTSAGEVNSIKTEGATKCIEHFMHEKLLFWLEALSVLGVFYKAAPLLIEGMKWVQVSPAEYLIVLDTNLTDNLHNRNMIQCRSLNPLKTLSL